MQIKLHQIKKAGLDSLIKGDHTIQVLLLQELMGITPLANPEAVE
jgi:hypothetical protein